MTAAQAPPVTVRGFRGVRGWLRQLAPLAVLPPATLVAWYVLAFDPTDRVGDPLGHCAWHEAFGINGPSCGGTRMVWYLLHGDLVQAARHHLLALLAVPYLAYGYLWWAAHALFGVRLPALRPRWRLLLGYGMAFLLYGAVLRNLPWPPFSWFNIAYLER